MEKDLPELSEEELEEAAGGFGRRSGEVYRCPYCDYTEDKTRLMMRAVKACPKCGKPLELH